MQCFSRPGCLIRKTKFFNLDAILSAGYRVNSKRGTQFGISAMRTLREHLLRRYTLSRQWPQEPGLSEIEQAVGLLRPDADVARCSRTRAARCSGLSSSTPGPRGCSWSKTACAQGFGFW
jgi:hypothetical protein